MEPETHTTTPPSETDSPPAETSALALPSPATAGETPNGSGVDDVFKILTNLWEQVSGYLGQQKQPLTLVAIGVMAIFGLILATTTLRVIHAFPLLPSLLELVGFGFALWFSYRYLVMAERRQELANLLTQFRQRILGD